MSGWMTVCALLIAGWAIAAVLARLSGWNKRRSERRVSDEFIQMLRDVGADEDFVASVERANQQLDSVERETGDANEDPYGP